MSILKKSAIALALTASLGLAGTASAATLAGPGTNGAPIKVAYFTVNAAGDVATTGQFGISIQSGDNLAGRTTGLGIRITLPAGVKLNSAAVNPGSGAGTGGTASIVSGTGTNVVTISVTPGSSGLNTTGPVVTLDAVDVTGATALANDGGSVAATVDFYDPNTAQTLTSTSGTLMVGANPISVTTTAASSNARIDVGAAGTGNTNNLPKVLFAANGTINGSDVAYFGAGTIASAADSNIEDATTGGDYVTTTGDTLSTTLTGSFAAFGNTGASVELSSASCASPSNVADGVVSADSKSVTFADYTYTSGPLYVCFNADGQDAIDATDVSAATSFTYAGSVTTPAQSGSLQSLQYNGSSVKVATFNPGGNTTQQSFLRVINGGQLSGKVTIYGYDQTGMKAGPVTFDLASGQSMQLNSDDLSNGNSAKFTGSLGTGVGKWRLDITGEFDGLEVQSLMRNNNSGTVSNLTGSVKSN